MAIQTLCAKLVNGFDASCDAPARKYFQQAVVINKSDILDYQITQPAEGECAYSATLTLKDGTKGYRFIGPEAGSNFFGSFDKSRSDLGYAQYAHTVQVLLTGATEEAKCIIEALDKGSFVVALQLKDGTVELYGLVNGLTTGDYTYNLQDGGGGAPVVLSSLDDAPENKLPFVYKSATADGEGADFDAAFEPVAGV